MSVTTPKLVPKRKLVSPFRSKAVLFSKTLSAVLTLGSPPKSSPVRSLLRL